ncbi:hypothetical protein SUGI_1055540 [Cryptomeria japonica]|nr:hypothetical protein SUGI_1055540 [Cryptomeria japonica]
MTCHVQEGECWHCALQGAHQGAGAVFLVEFGSWGRCPDRRKANVGTVRCKVRTKALVRSLQASSEVGVDVLIGGANYTGRRMLPLCVARCVPRHWCRRCNRVWKLGSMSWSEV